MLFFKIECHIFSTMATLEATSDSFKPQYDPDYGKQTTGGASGGKQWLKTPPAWIKGTECVRNASK